MLINPYPYNRKQSFWPLGTKFEGVPESSKWGKAHPLSLENFDPSLGAIKVEQGKTEVRTKVPIHSLFSSSLRQVVQNE